MKTYNTVIVGGGVSGVLAGIHLDDDKSIILEKNSTLLKKILVTGGGRCNITNNNPLETYIQSYYNSGNYYRTAFNNFFNSDIIELLEKHGCKTKTEDDKRVFPVTDKATSVQKTLIEILDNTKTNYQLNTNVTSITREDDFFLITYNNGHLIKSENIILSTGGDSYPETGSDGSGYKLAVKLGHSITEHMGGLSPIETYENWVRKLSGISIDAKITIKADKKKISTTNSSIMFTHNGLSGHAVLDNSMLIENHLRQNHNVKLELDLAKDYNHEQLDQKLLDDFKEHPTWGLKRYMHEYMPKSMVTTILKQLEIKEDTKLNQVSKKDRYKIRDNLKRLEFTVKSVQDKHRMVTNSGVRQDQINPNTMESRLVDNLYFTGELIEGCGMCGGFNLQKAYSTGVLAATTIKGVKR